MTDANEELKRLRSENEQLRAELEALRGLRPAQPQAIAVQTLPRYGLIWAGVAGGTSTPIAVPMPDGYWTPWHFAEKVREVLEGIIEIGKRDLTNPKYDGYFDEAYEVLGRKKAVKKS